MNTAPTFDSTLPREKVDAHLARLGARRNGGSLPRFIVYDLAAGGQARVDVVKSRPRDLRLRVWSGRCACDD